jgi:ParB family chromosome partitioning protein|tara:strand:- start:125 stop:889 length:765 start_codon:yes stop_codon:yes gene_type:complete
MEHKIHKDLVGMAVPLDTLRPLENNPRVGDVVAIAASYDEFGQVKPIVIRENVDGSATVIAGNHQVEAAKRLGWTHIAAVSLDADDKRAVAFALADNRTMELGHSDSTKTVEMIVEVVDEYDDLMDNLGWDEFEIAMYEEQADAAADMERGSSIFIPPQLIEALGELVHEDEDGERRIIADDSIDHDRIAVQGSTVTPQGAAPQAVVQYALVFDNPDQQQRWYEFIRWLRGEPGYEGVTTAEKLMTFIDAHSEA